MKENDENENSVRISFPRSFDLCKFQLFSPTRSVSLSRLFAFLHDFRLLKKYRVFAPRLITFPFIFSFDSCFYFFSILCHSMSRAVSVLPYLCVRVAFLFPFFVRVFVPDKRNQTDNIYFICSWFEHSVL